MQTCSIEGCEKPSAKRGWCAAHYGRWQRKGDPLAGKPIRASPGDKIKWLEQNAKYDGDDCLRWPFAYEANGYGSIIWMDRNTSASRVMCILAHGDPPSPEYEAAHSCGNGKGGCINPSHLGWATSRQNQGDRIAHGTDNRGERSFSSKLTEGDVRHIRSLQGKEGPTSIGRRFGISKTAVTLIWKRKNWGWLD